MTIANRQARKSQARATQRRIVDAATELFVRDGYLQTTVTAIAKHAGVAVQTLYLSFGSKDAILAAALDVAIAGDDEPQPVLERPWVREVRTETGARRALALFVETACEIVARVQPLYSVAQRASADPDLADLLNKTKRRRQETFAAVVAILAEKPGFAAGMSVQRATAVMYVLLSEESYQLLVVEQGWSEPDWREWVLRTAASQLLRGTRRMT